MVKEQLFALGANPLHSLYCADSLAGKTLEFHLAILCVDKNRKGTISVTRVMLNYKREIEMRTEKTPKNFWSLRS